MAVVRYIGRQTKIKATVLNLETEYITLITELKDTLYRLARSIVLNSAEAEDIVQDLFERAWRARDSVLRSEYPRAYLCRMAHNLAIDRLRHSARQREFSEAKGNMGVADGNVSIDNSDVAQLTRQLIDRLPERQRVAIHMRDVEGYEIEEIAQVLECDETSVRMNLSRARKSIREQLIKVMNYGVERS